MKDGVYSGYDFIVCVALSHLLVSGFFANRSRSAAEPRRRSEMRALTALQDKVS
jgi:hypothetical protein